ncbi:MAG: transporter [Sideroxydans sp.]|nr:transporter [Sideroxydans sp.]
MKIRFTLYLPLSLSLLATPALHAEPIVADRPGFSTGIHTVTPGHCNIELGFQGSDVSETLPLSNVRIGLTPKAEVDVQWGGWTFANGSSTLNNLSLGGKYRLDDRGPLKLTMLGLLSLPSGNGNPSGSRIAPQAALLWNRSDLFGMFQLASSHTGSLQTQVQAAIGKSFSHSAQLGSYLELYVDHPLNHAGGDSIMLDGGFAYLLDARTQLDLHLGLDVNSNAANFIGFGFARSY